MGCATTFKQETSVLGSHGKGSQNGVATFEARTSPFSCEGIAGDRPQERESKAGHSVWSQCCVVPVN